MKSEVLALVPKVSGGLSLIGSSFILSDIAKQVKRKRPLSTFYRLMIGLSVSDLVASTVSILSTWPIPYGTEGVYGAVGNTQFCTAQGLFNEVANLSSPLYNASLCTYYILIIRYQLGDRKAGAYEKYLHAVPLLFGFTMGFLGLGFNLFNASGWLCWIAPYPAQCTDEDIECTRGLHAGAFRWVHYAIVWCAITYVTVSMSLIYASVRRQEQATLTYTIHRRASIETIGRTDPDSTGRRSSAMRTKELLKSRTVANQAFLFVIAMYMTWIFTTLTRIFQTAAGKNYFPLLLLMAIFFPLQGFFNALIYLRPRYIKVRSKEPNLSAWEAAKISILYPKRLSDGRLSSVVARRKSSVGEARRSRKNSENILARRASLGMSWSVPPVEIGVNEAKVPRSEQDFPLGRSMSNLDDDDDDLESG